MANNEYENNNSIFMIHPYKRNNAWAFDDAQKGLYREGLISGADDLIEMAVTRAGIPGADFERGITVIFSANPFPGEQLHVRRTRPDRGGYWYYSPDYQFEGWLCSNLFRYFAAAPEEIHFRIKPRQ